MRPALLLTMALLAVLAFAACDDNGYGDSDGDASPTAPTGATPTPFPSESGAEPVFWRTTDNFASLAAGTEYKVVFRVTSGYEEDTLTIVADRAAGGGPVEFTGNRVVPAGGDAPGAFYPVTIILPQPGSWELTIMAGADEVTIPVDAAEPGPASAG